MTDPFNSAFYFKFAKDWLPRLSAELTHIRSKRKKLIDKVADIFGDPRELAKFYIEPDCQQFNPSDELEDDVVREPVFSRIERFFSKEKQFGKQLFVLSDAGMGKTSLLLMLYLGHIKSFWPKGFRCILLKLGRDTEKHIDEIESRSETVLLLDALDEDPLAWGSTTERISDILKATQTFRRVIVTCRTQFFSAGREPFNRRGQVEVGGFLCPVIFISLFNDIQVSKYLNKRFPGQVTKIQESKLLLSKMGSLRMRPMLLAHIEDLLDSDTKDWDEFSIYEALLSAWLLREQQKVLERKDGPIPSKDKLWEACRCIAGELHTNTQLTITESKMKQILIQNPEVMHLESVDIGGRSLLNKNSDGDFRFSHYSVQEFLIAHGVLKNLFMRQVKPFRATDQIVRFLKDWLGRAEPQDRSGARFSLLDLSKTNLAGIDLSSLDIQGGRFVGADLQLARFMSSNISGCRFESALLDHADLTGSNLEYSNLNDASLVQACLENVRMSNASAADANFQKSSLSNSDLSQACLDRAKMHEVNFAGSNLKECSFKSAMLPGANLRNTDLSNADFEGANLDGTMFEGATISGTILVRASARSAVLKNMDLSTAEITGAILNGAMMESANLDGRDLRRTNFDQANLRGASLEKTDMRQASLVEARLETANLTEANLEDAILRNAYLQGAIFNKTRLARANLELINFDGFDFSGYNLAACSFGNCSLRNVCFDRCVLDYANFKSANLRGASFKGARVGEADFDSADLREADLGGLNLGKVLLKGAILSGQDLSEFNFTGCDLRECQMQDVCLEGSNLAKAQLNRANLTSANLSRCDFRESNLKNAVLRGVDLRESNLCGADLREADLAGANLQGAKLENIKYNTLTIWPKGFVEGGRFTSARSPI